MSRIVLHPDLKIPDHVPERLERWLQDQVSGDRYQHSIGAMRKAEELARNFKLTNAQVQKAAIAGLLHDCAKQLPPGELFRLADVFSLDVDYAELDSPQTLHPFVGAALLQRDFDIRDEEILNAIRYHTTGRPAMSAVERVVYVADKIEENTRNPLYTQKIHDLIDYSDRRTLDRAVLYIMDSTVTFLLEKQQMIHPRTIEARNELLRSLKKAYPHGLPKPH